MKQKKNRASSLVLVLSIVVILSVLILSMTIATRMESTSAHSYSERARADLFAATGIECVKAALLEATATGHTWISMPGCILSVSGTTQNFSKATVYNLFSGTTVTTASTNTLSPPDLNQRILSDDNKDAIDPTSGAAMPVAWVYVRQNGTYETSQNQLPANNTANPIIGRFAYWTDDESARVDLNTAWQSTNNPATASHPDVVALSAIPGIAENFSDQIHNQATNVPFGSPDEARRLDPSLADILSTNRFLTTYRTHSDDLNPWGSPKIYLTTQVSNLPPGFTNYPDYTNYFFDILSNPNTDPGSAANIDSKKYLANLNRIMALFQRSDWPYGSGSLSGKYGATNAMQIAMDIMGNVRSAESTNNFLEAMYVQPSSNLASSKVGTAGIPPNGLTVSNLLVDSVRRPLLCEIGAYFSDFITSPHKQYQINFKLKFYFPPNSGIKPSMLIGNQIRGVVAYEADPGNWVSVSPGNLPITSLDQTDPNYGVVTLPYLFTLQGDAASHTNRPTSVYANFSLRPLGTTTTLETAPIASYGFSSPTDISAGTNAMIHCAVDPVGTTLDNITTVKANDPRVNKYGLNWDSTNSAADWQSLPAPLTVAVSPPQDQSNGTASESGLFLFPPKEATNNPQGQISSVGALGYVATGIGANIPWRTVHLQPNPDRTTLPDWALLDLFSAPIAPTNQTQTIFPDTNAVAGRLNLNASIQPFTNMTRGETTLRALFADPSSAMAATVASNITHLVFATNGSNYGRTDSFGSIGELAEISGVADSGEASEDTLRQIIDKVTVRGNVFRIHTVGQALKQTINGSLTIQAERRITALVERRSDGSLHVIYWKIVPL